MTFVVDECTGPKVAAWLRSQGYELVSIYDEARGAKDDEVLRRSEAEGRILITADKDFGDLIFREKRPHRGVVLLRATNPCPARHIEMLGNLLTLHAASLPERFIVVTDAGIRIANP